MQQKLVYTWSSHSSKASPIKIYIHNKKMATAAYKEALYP